MRKMRALKDGVKYGARTYNRGDSFDADERHALVLYAAKTADYARLAESPAAYQTRQMNGEAVAAPTIGLDGEAEKPKRRYKRRDMTAEGSDE